MNKRIVIMAGGTGGHVFPALAVAQALQGEGWKISWLGTRKGLESRVIPEQKIEIDWLSVTGVRGKGRLTMFKAPLMLAKACYQALCILHQRKPDVVLGMGGFVAGPGGLMARLLGIPLIIHEQNLIPGTTNRYLAKIASRVLQAFPDSFPKSVKAQCTGNPLRKQFIQQPADVGQKDHDELRLLVVGGSLGAKVLNETLPPAVVELDDIHVKHQTGTAMLEQVSQHYEQLGITANTSAFIEDMVQAYQWADLIVCRAGAMTVSEVAAMGLPSIMVPFPFAIDDHQTANAQFLVHSGAARMIAESELSATLLAKSIREVRSDLNAMAKAARLSACMQATEDVVEICKQEADV